MDTLKPRPCPIEKLVAHSEEHFIDRRAAPSELTESFGQLAARRAGNMDLMIRFLETLVAQAPNYDTLRPVTRAIDSLIEARGHLREAEVMSMGRW